MPKVRWSHMSPCENCKGNEDLRGKILKTIKWTYRIKKRVGDGGFGTVYKANRIENARNIAMKFLFGPKSRHQYLKEVDFTKLFTKRSPRYFIEYIDDFEFNHYKSIVMELMPMSLMDYLEKQNFLGLSLTQIKHFLKQMLDVLIILEEEHIIHADIKPDNVMVFPSVGHVLLHIKLIDYGISEYSLDYKPTGGTANYDSPEGILKLGKTYSSDVFSTAWTSLNAYAGGDINTSGDRMVAMSTFLHYLGPAPEEILQKALDQPRNTNDFFSIEHCSEGSKYVFRRFDEYPMKHKDRKPMFASMEELIGHTGRTGIKPGSKKLEAEARDAYLQLMYQMLEYDPTKRITPKEALKHKFINMKWGQLLIK